MPPSATASLSTINSAPTLPSSTLYPQINNNLKDDFDDEWTDEDEELQVSFFK